MYRHQARIGLLLLASAGFAGAVAAGTAPHYPAGITGYGCANLGLFTQLHSAKDRARLLADNPLSCRVKPERSSQDWAWASSCTGCRKLTGKVDVVPDGSFEDMTDSWYVTLSDGTKAYTVGLPIEFDAGTRMVRLWVEASSVHRLDGKPLPENPKS